MTTHSTEISVAPVIINVTGNTVAERKLSALDGAAQSVYMALINAKGEIGKKARAAAGKTGLVTIAESCFNANYRPLAQYLAAQMGEPVVISNRISFESLPDFFEQRVLKIKGGKNGGYRTDAKGVQVPTAALGLMLTLKSEVVEIIAAVAEAKNRMAEEKAAQEQQAQIEG